jgi:16S rRNA (cytidine1402-2'-O)-methyltransferase
VTTPEPPAPGAAPDGPPPLPALASVLQQAASAAAGTQQYPAATLYVVGTPIGNLADLSLRAIEVLRRADAVACEDRRVTTTLLRHLGLHKPLVVAHQHQERAAAQAVLERLGRGERVALVSDAGTPALSDPGALLVDVVRSAGHRVVPVPGPSAALAALSVSGPVGDTFRFVGFLPAQGAARQSAVAALAHDPAASVVYEAPHRITAIAEALAAACPARRITLARELTKQFEQVVTRTAAELPAWLAADADHRRGEFALVLHGLAPPAASDAAAAMPALDATLRVLLAELSLRQSAALAGRLHGVTRDTAYARALALRRADSPADAADAAEATDSGNDDALAPGTRQDAPAPTGPDS